MVPTVIEIGMADVDVSTGAGGTVLGAGGELQVADVLL